MQTQSNPFLFALSISLCLFLINGCSQSEAATVTATSNPPTPTLAPTETSTPEPTPTPLPLPVAQGYHHMAYDEESDKVILVPVQGNNFEPIGSQTWIFDLNAKIWQKSDGPTYGEGPMAYDSQSDRIILFQGTGGKTTFVPIGKTWAFDTNTKTWEEMEPVEGPSGILGERMVYDSESDRIILFGGLEVTGRDAFGAETSDIWAYDYDTNTWTYMQPGGNLDFPQGENFFAMSYDAGADRVIAWQCTATLSENKIIIYDYNSNTLDERETDTHPNYCVYNAMVYDPGTGLNILFGGVTGSEKPSNETWGYDYETNTWQLISAANPPAARGWHAMVYDTAAHVMVLFGGGVSRNEFTNETWIYDPIKNEWSNVIP